MHFPLETGAMRAHTLFVGHSLGTVVSPAGPIGTPTILPLDGKPRVDEVVVGRRKPALADFEVYDGTISVLRPGHVALLPPGRSGALGLDVAADTGVELPASKRGHFDRAPLIPIITASVASSP